MKKLFAVLPAILALNVFAATDQPPRPNVLVILTDDIGWGDYKCYNPHGKIASPNVDRLALEGMRFTHAHTAAALCAPSRYSMLTGNYPWRGRSAAGTWVFNVPSSILPAQKTVANLLQTANYHTAMFGKAGIGGTHATTPAGLPDFSKPMTEGPVQWGFEYSFIIPRGHQWRPQLFLENGVASCDPAKILHGNGDATKKTPGYGTNDADFRDPDWDTREVGSRLLNHVEKFLDGISSKDKAAGVSRPFFIHFCTDGAHALYEPPEEIRGTPVLAETEMTAHTDMVYETDVLVGKLRDILEARGLLKNTLICVTSDNGGIPAEQKFGHDAVGGLRGMKFCIGEGGTRVPFIVRWPDKIPAGVVRDQNICVHDIIPTALELAGVDVPDNQCLDAVSLLPVFLGQRDDRSPIRATLLTQSSPSQDAFFDGNIKGGPIDMKAALRVRQRRSGDLYSTPDETALSHKAPAEKPPVKKSPGSGKSPSDNMAHAIYEQSWKLVMNIQDEPAALYDLGTDPAEQTNLIKTEPDRVQSMQQDYRTIRSSKRSTPSGSRASAK